MYLEFRLQHIVLGHNSLPIGNRDIFLMEVILIVRLKGRIGMVGKKKTGVEFREEIKTRAGPGKDIQPVKVE